MLTGFDYARPEDPRSNSVLDRLAEVLDPAYRRAGVPEPPGADEPGLRRVRGRRDRLPAADRRAPVRLLDRPVPAGQRAAARPDDRRRPATAAHRPAAAGCARRHQRRRPTAAEAEESLAAAGMSQPVRTAGDRGWTTGTCPRATSSPASTRCSGRSAAGRSASSTRCTTTWRTRTGPSRSSTGTGTRTSPGLSRSTGPCSPCPPHPNVVRVESADYLDGQDVPYLVFEYLDGKDVSDLVKDRALGPADTVRLGIEVATGLAFLHANGVYHCDIKPSNLLWTDQGARSSTSTWPCARPPACPGRAARRATCRRTSAMPARRAPPTWPTATCTGSA